MGLVLLGSLLLPLPSRQDHLDGEDVGPALEKRQVRNRVQRILIQEHDCSGIEITSKDPQGLCDLAGI